MKRKLRLTGRWVSLRLPLMLTAQAMGNPLCLQVAWRNPSADADAAVALRRWEEGCTGVPLVVSVRMS